MDSLTLRPTTGQLRNLVLATCASGLAAALLLHEHLAGNDGNGRILGWGIACAAAMLLIASVTIAYSRAVTECTDAGIRVRGLGLERRWRWDQVSDVSIRLGSRGNTRTVMLTPTDGRQILLGAPVTGGLMPDPDFDRKVGEIQRYWRRASELNRGYARIAWAPATSYRGSARSTLVVLVTLAALGLTAATPVLAREDGQALLVRLGQGHPGTFTVYDYYYYCIGPCPRVGDFTAADGSARRDGVTIASGGSSPQASSVPAVDAGSAGLVYPAGGGTAWIPLGVMLALLAGCLTVDALWVTSRVRQRRAQHEREPLRGPPMTLIAGGAPRPVRVRTAIATGAVCLVVAGTVAGVLFWPLPSPARSPTTVQACADYSEWLAAQKGTAEPWNAEGALARAAEVAPNDALGNDLSALRADVAAAAQYARGPGDPANVGAEADVTVMVTTDTQAVIHDCFG